MRTLINKYGYTYQEAAAACRVDLMTVKRWCRYGYKFTDKEINKIARAFGISVDEVCDYVC